MPNANPLRRRLAPLLALVVLALAAPALAQDGGDGGGGDAPVAVTEADYATYAKIRRADALLDARRLFSRGEKAKLDAIEAERAKLASAAGWTDERYQAVRDALVNAAQALGQEAMGGDDAAAAKESLAAFHATTLATARAHQKEIADESAMRQAAEKQVRDEREAEKRGAPPDAKTLEGTWVLDVEASIAQAVDMLPASATKERAELREKLRKAMPKTTYVFGPGDAMESRGEDKDGKPKVDKATYRTEGSKILVKPAGRTRENTLEAGIKDGNLQVGTFGVYLVFRKQK